MTEIRYPTITGAGGRQFFDSCDPNRIAEVAPRPDELPIEWIHAGPELSGGVARLFDTRALYDFGVRATRQIARGVFDAGTAAQAGERFEAAHALEFHELLTDVPGAILNDRAFWRFLALGPLCPCVVWRQRGRNLPTAFGLPPRTGRRTQERSFSLTRNLPWRLYMRAEIGGPEYVGVLSADLWWSHLFRVALGRSPITARAFLEQARDQDTLTRRQLAPLVTADRGRFVFDALDDDEVAIRVRRSAERVAGRARAATTDEPSDPALEDEPPGVEEAD